jgi:hypothetical protein
MNTLQITPFMHVHAGAFDAALSFWQSMGFAVRFRHPGYAYVEREGAGVRMQAHREEDQEIAPGRRGFRYYVDVRDVDRVYDELKPALMALPAGDVYGPIDQAYGQRELIILAPDGDLLVFGAAIRIAGNEVGDGHGAGGKID